jgi:predicted  nucleic acid-binding Zn-ribbon protein
MSWAQRRRYDVERLQADLAEAHQAMARAEAALGGMPSLKIRNWFVNSLFHGERERCDRIAPLWKEYRKLQREVARITKKLSSVEADVDTTPQREEVPRSDLDRSALSARVAREKKARRTADGLLAEIEKTRKWVKQAGRRRAQDDASRTEVDQDAKGIARKFRRLRRHTAALKAEVPSDLPANLDSIARLDMRFSGSRVADDMRAKEYEDATLALDALAEEVKPLQRQLVFRETEAKRVKRTSSR